MSRAKTVFKITKSIRIILTFHLFQKREGEDKARISVFRNSFQFTDLIRYAIENFDLLSFKDKGKVALITPLHNGRSIETYGVALSVETSKSTKWKTDIVIITIDKQDSRHYTKSLQMVNTKHRLYLNKYKPFRSFRTRFCTTLDTFKTDKSKNVTILSTEYFQKNKMSYLSLISGWYFSFLLGVFNHEIARVNKGAFWCKVPVSSKEFFFLKIAIETNWNQDIYNLLLLDTTEKLTENMKEYTSGYLYDFSKHMKKKQKLQTRGIKIIKKKGEKK